MKTMEKVNCIKRQRRYKARDKEELIFSIIQLHNQGYSQVNIAKKRMYMQFLTNKVVQI
ncbi:hypothetical protein MKX73_18515 [Solibacillus sp. FSL W7-1436]|uniref:hypothetical protein n=1 Tax=Solibacillus sp. FSL W7-1436 TaxID=2921705 RepID=UPI0030F65941